MTQPRGDRQRNWPEAQTPPARFERIMERVRELDRDYFAEYPGAISRCRPFVPGESYPYRLRDCDEVIVRQVKPGIRLVMPLVPGGTTLVWAQVDLAQQGGQR